MALPTQTYDFGKVAVLRGGVPIIGFADGDSISIEHPEKFTLQVGAGGATTRSRQNNPTATVTLRLQQRSPSNVVLEAAALADEATGLGAVPLLVKDLTGAELFFAGQSWVEARPTQTFGSDSGVREWKLRCSGVK